MTYYGTVKKEEIAIRQDNGSFEYVILAQSCDIPTFVVQNTYDNDWTWEFWMEDPSVYEMVKHMVMDATFESDDMDELMEDLDELFEEYFADFVVDEEECDGDCENCKYEE